MMWLVKWEDNWADEMDLQGFALMTNEEFVHWARLVDAAAKKIDSGVTFDWYVGTNEWVDYDNGDDFKKASICEMISDKDAEVLKRTILGGSKFYGLFPSEEDLNYFLGDEE